MSAETYRGSVPQEVLDQLTTAMGIENRIGSDEEAKLGAPGRVVWVPPQRGTRRYNGTSQQRSSDLHVKHVHAVDVSFLVHLWAASYTGAEELEQKLEAALYTVFSPNAYELGPEGEQRGENAATGQGRGWLFIVPVRLLRIPIPVERYRTVTLTSATATTTITDPKGGTPSSGPTPSITFP